MSGWSMGVIELGLIFLPILAWAFWELWALRRDRKRDEVQSAERARHAEGQHGADDGGSQPS